MNKLFERNEKVNRKRLKRTYGHLTGKRVNYDKVCRVFKGSKIRKKKKGKDSYITVYWT